MAPWVRRSTWWSFHYVLNSGELRVSSPEAEPEAARVGNRELPQAPSREGAASLWIPRDRQPPWSHRGTWWTYRSEFL
jgi:hypothetical protein